MGEVVEGVKFEQKHGKERVRVGRVWRNQNDGFHYFVEWSVGISLFSDCVAVYVRDDNSDLVASDTLKNTVLFLRLLFDFDFALFGIFPLVDSGFFEVYVKTKECTEQISAEEFAIKLANHFMNFYLQCPLPLICLALKVAAAVIKIVEKPWDWDVATFLNVSLLSFKLGSEKTYHGSNIKKSGALRIASGIEGLALLKTAKVWSSCCCIYLAQVRFIRDKYTTLPETQERMLATEVTTSWSYPFEFLGNVPLSPDCFTKSYIHVKQVLVEAFYGSPKKGVYNASGQSTLLSDGESCSQQFDNDVYLPTDEPHGSIEASLSRLQSKM
ncbi:Uricase [Dillenia turbinata]|uniref:Uricase n=1 Tax=Dillenia turbinata TaxID=194707 RepID=A0AAN8VQ01_9MAGN